MDADVGVELPTSLHRGTTLMPEAKKKKKANPTQELLMEVLAGQRRIEERMAGLETQQTLANQAWQRQGRVVEEINQRCMEKLGMKCPLIPDDDNGVGDADDSG